MGLTWRNYVNWAKESRSFMRVADKLGRGQGRMRVLDALYRPPAAPKCPDISDWSRRGLSAVWIGHATLLLRVGGLTVLTDPVFSTRIGIGLGLATAGPARKYAPALSIDQLPSIDLILLSHAHFDHLDRPTLARFPRSIPLILAEHTADLVRDLGFSSVREIGWDQSIQFGPLKLTGRKVKHWGARTFHDAHRSFNAYLIESAGARVLFGGDSAYQNYFRDIGPIDLAILGIAAYDPYLAAHATPEQAWEMFGHANAAHLLPMHHSTFRLSHEPMHEPMQRLLKTAGVEQDRIIARHIGDQWTR